MKAFKLWLVAIFLITVVNLVNRMLFKKKIKNLPRKERKIELAKYDRREAMALDAFANRNYSTFWNDRLKTPDGYKFGVLDEMISSALGKNEYDSTLTQNGKGRWLKWFCGKWLVDKLNKIETNHCIDAIDLTKGEWNFKNETGRII